MHTKAITVAFPIREFLTSFEIHHPKPLSRKNATNLSFFCLPFQQASAILLIKGELMSKHDKLVTRFLTRPVDFTWDEMTALLNGFGYFRVKAGKTGGSRVRFAHQTADTIILHQPHPLPSLKRYQIEQVEEILKRGDLV
ncbi:MAG: type II toxin-antitoxin system HicA family toxin [Syntrophales bacterium]